MTLNTPQLCSGPTEIWKNALAGGVALPPELLPQQTTLQSAL
ncbi:MAG TPA: hypothetical protein VGO65_11915 [Pseudolysinimonas sp.]|nr:hypothetical protein [Pseudolysinimonas sp.]